MSWQRRIVIWFGVIAIGYVGIALLVFLMQERLIFIGAYFGRRPIDTLEGVSVESMRTEDGTAFRVARSAPADDTRGVVVGFLGNGEDLSSGVHHAALWREYGFESFIVEYPGYGESEGSPGMASIYAAARVAAGAAHERARALDVPFIAMGVSLGTFSAVYVASELPVARLVLNAPPTSLVAAAHDRYPWLPTRWLLRHPFDSLALAPGIECPVWLVHGDRDGIVPQSMGRELAAAFAGPVEFVDATGFDHMIPLHRQGPFGASLNSFLAGR